MFGRRLVPRLSSSSIRKLGIVVLAAPWLLISPPAADAFDIIQITDNSTDDDRPHQYVNRQKARGRAGYLSLVLAAW